MAVISTPTKVRLGAKAARNPAILKLGAKGAKPAIKVALGAKAARGVARNPQILKLGAKGAKPAIKAGWGIGKPVARWRARRRYQQMLDTARQLGESLLTYGAEAAMSLGLVEPPPPKRTRTVPRVMAGAVIGAAAVYFLEPGSGREHREQLVKLVS
jgi:hypothetical protein